MIQVFSKDWFNKYQRQLLWLANTGFGRDLLVINGNKSSVDNNKIVRIDPNAITWFNGESFSTEFRTADKFARVIRHRFKYVWEMAHWFDMKVANRWQPAWNLGFDTFTGYPQSSGGGSNVTTDGYVYHNSPNDTWANIHNGAGTIAGYSGSPNPVTAIQHGTDADTFTRITRGIFTFDTISLGVGATINSGTFRLSLLRSAGTSAYGINIFSSAPATNNILVSGDYDSLGNTAFSTTLAFTDVGTGGYSNKTFNLNASGLSNVNPGGISRYGAREANFDAADSAPSWVSAANYSLSVQYAEATGVTDDPQLVIDYTPIYSIKDPLGFGPVPFPR